MTTTNLAIIASQTAVDTSAETPEQELARLRAENAKLKANKENVGTSMKVSEKGAVSVYGLGRFPVTLYKSQWLKLLAMAESIRTFIGANAHVLKEKPTKE